MDDGTSRTRHSWRGIRQWKVWDLPPRPLAYVLSVDTLAVTATVLAVVWVPDTQQWRLAALLALSAIAHLELSAGIERQRRDHSRSPHVDLCSIWIIAGAVVLTPLLTALLVVVVYGHRWWRVGRLDLNRPLYRALFSAFMMLGTAEAVATVSHLLRVPELLERGVDSPAVLLAIAVLGGLHWTVNTVVVGGIVALTTKVKRPQDVLGSWADNLLEIEQLGMGGLAAVVAVHVPYLLPLVVLPAFGLHRNVLMHQYKLAAQTDVRTGLLHAVAWTGRVEAEMARCRQEGRTSAVVMFDLDHFKRVNDTYGHLVGDIAIREFVRVLIQETRAGDARGRIGGEEFGLLLPGADGQAALAVAERIRVDMHDVAITDPATGTPLRDLHLSVSAGIALYPHAGIGAGDAHLLIAKADDALYISKKKRDTTTLHPDATHQPTNTKEDAVADHDPQSTAQAGRDSHPPYQATA